MKKRRQWFIYALGVIGETWGGFSHHLRQKAWDLKRPFQVNCSCVENGYRITLSVHPVSPFEVVELLTDPNKELGRDFLVFCRFFGDRLPRLASRKTLKALADEYLSEEETSHRPAKYYVRITGPMPQYVVEFLLALGIRLDAPQITIKIDRERQVLVWPVSLERLRNLAQEEAFHRAWKHIKLYRKSARGKKVMLLCQNHFQAKGIPKVLERES